MRTHRQNESRTPLLCLFLTVIYAQRLYEPRCALIGQNLALDRSSMSCRNLRRWRPPSWSSNQAALPKRMAACV